MPATLTPLSGVSLPFIPVDRSHAVAITQTISNAVSRILIRIASTRYKERNVKRIGIASKFHFDATDHSGRHAGIKNRRIHSARIGDKTGV